MFGGCPILNSFHPTLSVEFQDDILSSAELAMRKVRERMVQKYRHLFHVQVASLRRSETID